MNKIFYFLVAILTFFACQRLHSMAAQQPSLTSKFIYLSLESDGGMAGGSTYLQIRANGETIEVVTSRTDASITLRVGRVSEASIAAIESAAMEMLQPVPKRPKICQPAMSDVGSTRLKIDLQGQSHTWVAQGDICTAIESQRWQAIFNAITTATKNVLHPVAY